MRRTRSLPNVSGCSVASRLTPTLGAFAWVPQDRALLCPFLGRFGSPTKIDYRKKKGSPYSNLSTGGPSHFWVELPKVGEVPKRQELIYTCVFFSIPGWPAAVDLSLVFWSPRQATPSGSPPMKMLQEALVGPGACGPGSKLPVYTARSPS